MDESWISETDYNRQMWCSSNVPCTVTERGITPRLALITALDTDGRVYFALTHSITDSDVMELFFIYLARQLDAEDPEWRDNSIVLLDGAKYHTS